MTRLHSICIGATFMTVALSIATATEQPKVKASDMTYWSVQPLVKPAVPVNAANPIDAFINAKLAEKQIKPWPQADRRMLIRRLYFDLTGLPPSPDEADAFVADPDPKAYEKLVARLLDSPRYGERWARHWLDVVHYGDTHGYDKDKPRPNAWPYRDYVIRSLNADKPYARFIQEQIAGDALFPGTEDGVTALGFIAAGPWDFIGHAELPESKTDGQIARMLDRDDMLANTMNTFCATTIQCARCHDHKFDPITQEDYYRMTAVFAALDRADKTFDSDPEVARQRGALDEKRRKAIAAKQEAEDAIKKAGGDELANIDRMLAEARKPDEREERPEYGWHSAIAPKQAETKWVQVDLGAAQEIQRVVIVGCNDNFNNIGPGFGFPVRYKIEAGETEDSLAMLDDHTSKDVPNPGVAPQEMNFGEKRARFIRVTATKLAPRKNDFIFALAELQAFDKSGRNVALNAKVRSLDSIEAPVRWGRKNLTDGYFYGTKLKVTPASLAELEAERAALISRTVPTNLGTALDTAKLELAQADDGLKKLPAPKVVYAGTVYTGSGSFAGTGANGGKPRTIHILDRGDIKKPGREVGPGTVHFISGIATFDLPAGAGESDARVALAHWLTDERNPLTWRVIVNRVWHYHFGHGIVDSPNDFGRMGQPPSNQALLDWLAVTFRDDLGGSLKKLHTLIVTSEAWKRASVGTVDPHAQDIDPANALLWRQNRRKLEAEAIRDSILSVAGKLDLKMGGPGFADYVVEKPQHSPHYVYDEANVEDALIHRRAIYRNIVRSQPQPFMQVLDCADPSMSVDRRNETVNALQSLALMNDRLVVAMAQYFAERVEKLGAANDERVTAAFRLALSRMPTADERATLAKLADEQGLAAACRVILNLNEFAFVD